MWQKTFTTLANAVRIPPDTRTTAHTPFRHTEQTCHPPRSTQGSLTHPSYPKQMTSPKDPQTKDPQAEAEFTRKLLLGLISTLENKGHLSRAEVDSIILAARPATPQPKTIPTPITPQHRKVQTQWPTGVNQINPAQIAGLKHQDEEDVPVIDMKME